MRLINKQTGEVGYLRSINWNETALIIMNKNGVQLAKYHSLVELNEEWEDYKQSKEYWYVCSTRNYEATRVIIDDGTDFDRVQKDKEIGNYFESMEECEQAVEKLKAWKRLKDKGFRSFSSNICGDDFVVTFKLTNHVDYDQSIDDFECVFDFGGEE